ncbi:MAG: hypothetical protein IJT77_10215 [Clostridia bacterium]|nr:hypothetical protein [Clostridia bacterium]
MTFHLVLPNGKQYSIRNVDTLDTALRNKDLFNLSQTTSVSFATEGFDEESQSSLRYIHLMIKSMDRINNMINNSHSVYYAQAHPANYGYASYVPVEFEGLDAFYDLFRGSSIPVSGTDDRMSVGGMNAGIRLNVQISRDADGHPTGASVSGHMPTLVSGLAYQYLIDKTAICRVTDADLESLKLFLAIQNGTSINAEIGTKLIDTFIQVTLPALKKMDYVSLTVT